jgi:DNA mismatch endonuclease (patch repair protein)
MSDLQVTQLDRLPPDRRSWLMSRVRAKNTAPEMTVRRLVHGLGYRYLVHSSSLPGKPDIVFRPRRKAIFVHGCFWHWHENCRLARLPRSRLEYWLPKLSRNRERDAEAIAALNSLGWSVHVVWQCELRNIDAVVAALLRFLAPTSN